MVKEGGKIHAPPLISTPRLAPWDAVEELCSRLDRLIAILEAWTPVEPGVPPPVPPEVAVSVTTVWEAGDTKKLFNQALRAAGAYTTVEMANWTKGKRLIIFVTNTLDQMVLVQLVGHIRNTVIGSTNLNAPLPCAAFSNISVGLAWDDWHPYIGATLTLAAVPTTGVLKVEAVVQE